MSDLNVHHNHECNDDCDGLDMNEVTLEEVTEDTLTTVLKLNVSEEQKKFVAPNSVSIAQAHFSKTAWFRAICYDKIPVGFIMIDDNAEKAEYFLWRFMIDQRYQGNKIGRRAIELLVEHVKTRPNATELLTSCVPGEGSPDKFYENLGFVATGEVEDDENVYELKL